MLGETKLALEPSWHGLNRKFNSLRSMDMVAVRREMMGDGVCDMYVRCFRRGGERNSKQRTANNFESAAMPHGVGNIRSRSMTSSRRGGDDPATFVVEINTLEPGMLFCG